MLPSYPHPVIHPDLTIDASILANRGVDGVTVTLPMAMAASLPAGRYFLARCGAQSQTERAANWQIYARRPMFVADVKRLDEQNGAWTLLSTGPEHDPGVAWLAERRPGEIINLLGPLGNGFTSPGPAANVLLVSQRLHLPLFQTLVDAVLDRGGRLTVLILDEDAVGLDSARARLPLAVELRQVTDEAVLLNELAETLAWADHVCVAAAGLSWAQLAQAIRNARFRVEEGFAQVLVDPNTSIDLNAPTGRSDLLAGQNLGSQSEDGDRYCCRWSRRARSCHPVPRSLPPSPTPRSNVHRRSHSRYYDR
jgi:hypothetical protein